MPNDHNDIAGNIARIRDVVSRTAKQCGRDPETIRLLAVCKKVAEDKILAAVRAGVLLLGENYIQEAADKIKILAGITAGWHFIGHLQSNKATTAVRLFDLIHTVDSFKLAAEIDRQAQKINKIQNILIQVDMASEPTKFGADPEETLDLIGKIAKLNHIAVKGLMTLPPYCENAEDTRPYFKALFALHRRIADAAIPGVEMKELSMGMSGDYQVAVEEGATLIRIGTVIFGERK